jgi:hypothetical protein
MLYNVVDGKSVSVTIERTIYNLGKWSDIFEKAKIKLKCNCFR